MEMLRSSVMAACALGVVFMIISYASPSEKYAGQMKLIFSLIFVLTAVKPFAGQSADVYGIVPDCGTLSDDYSVTTDRLLEKEVGAQLSERICELLSENGISAVKVSVTVNNITSDSISIIKAEVQTENAEDAERAVRMVAGSLDIDEKQVTVTWGRNENGVSLQQ